MRHRRLLAALAASALLHALLPVSFLRFTPRVPTPARRPIAVFIVALENPRFPGLQPFDTPQDALPRSARNLKALPLGRVRIDVKKIAARMHVLFPALTPGLALDYFVPRQGALPFPSFLAEASASPAPAGGPLVLDEGAVQSIVDRAWARRDRWSAFGIIAKLIATHAPGGSLPRILRAYREQDALQPYTDRDTRDPRLWTQLSLAADHVSFIGFIRAYVSSHPSTQESAELLLLLDTIVQAEQDALHVMLDTEPAADLDLTRDANPGAYDLVVQIRQEYRRELTRRGLGTAARMDRYYEDVRLAILGRVIANAPDGYGADDARFLVGAIDWRAGRRSEALRVWRSLTARADGIYARSSADLRRVVQGPSVDDSDVTRILKIEDGRWLSLS